MNAEAATFTISDSESDPIAVSSGDTVTVTGTGALDVLNVTNGIDGDTVSNVTVTVQSGGQITAQGSRVTDGVAGRAIDLGDNATINVKDGATVEDFGLDVTFPGDNASAIVAGANSAINVDGTVFTTRPANGKNNFSPGIVAGAGSVITVGTNGLVKSRTSNGPAIELSGGGMVVNAGTIQTIFLANADVGVINIPAGNSTVTNNGSILTNGAHESIVMGTGGTSTGNVVNLYGNANVVGSMRNDGASGGALVNFGYTGSAADLAAAVSVSAAIGLAGNPWDGHVYAGTSTINASGTFNNLQIDSGATLTANDYVSIGGTFTNTGTLNSTSNYIQNDGSTLSVLANSNTNYGKIVTTSPATVSADSTLKFNLTGTISDNTDFKVIDTSGQGIGNVPGTITTDSAFFSFTASDASGDLVVTSHRTGVTFNSIAANTNAGSVGTVLDNMNNPSSEMSNILSALEASPASEVANSINSFSSKFDNTIPQVSQTTMDQFVAKTINHTSTSDNSVPTGVSTGSEMRHDWAMWAEGFGGGLHQLAQEASQGYNARIGGTILGIERDAWDTGKAGFSQGCSQSLIRGKDNANNSNIASFQSSFYGLFNIGAYYVNAAFSFGYNRYHNSREVNDLGTILTAVFHVGGEQYSPYIEGGYTFNYGNWQITPLASFEYMKLYIPGYTESGAGALDLQVDAQDYNSAQTGFGFKLGCPIADKFLPEFKFKWLHDWVGDPMENTASFTGGGTSFKTVGFTPDRNTYELGAQLTLLNKGAAVVSVSYNADFRKNFVSNVGYLNVRHDF